LKQYNTAGVEPTATVLGQVNVFRPDDVRPSLSVDRALANAPESADGFFVVPKIIEDRQPH
jgi:aspartyl-tRNA(Asn)/glutamyl-tRNA(Gln) amidotransferase subunit C